MLCELIDLYSYINKGNFASQDSTADIRVHIGCVRLCVLEQEQECLELLEHAPSVNSSC